jgi:NAD(P)-dependent dehydrogenase (short-subunit alcohol dehydrogenase family)
MAHVNERVAIVTGAGSGIGRCAAVRLAGAGWRVAVAARTLEDLEETARLCREAWRGESGSWPVALVIPTDVGRSDACRGLVEETLAGFGRLDALVNNAGVAPSAPIEETDEPMIRGCFDVNSVGPAMIIHHAWGALRACGGSIVNVSSLATEDPFPGFFVYAASKAALEMLALVAAREGAESGVRAWSVAPGAVETPTLRRLFDEAALPRDRTLDPDEVAGVIVDLLTGVREEPSGSVVYLRPPAGSPA